MTQQAPDARRLIIDMALARAGRGTGSSAPFMQRRTAMQQFPDLRPIENKTSRKGRQES
jgi:hypothetical protein